VVHHHSSTRFLILVIFLLEIVLHFREKLDIENKQASSFQAYDGASAVHPDISLLLAALP